MILGVLGRKPEVTQPYDLYFSFNGNLINTGTLVGITATPTSAPTYTANSLVFGVAQRIDVDATSLELLTNNWQFSVELNISIGGSPQTWFRKANAGGTEFFEIGKNTNEELYFYKDGTGGLVFLQTSASAISLNTDHLIEVYFDGTSLKIDVDGVNKLTNNQTGLNVVANGGIYSIGARGVTNTTFGRMKNLYFNVD